MGDGWNEPILINDEDDVSDIEDDDRYHTVSEHDVANVVGHIAADIPTNLDCDVPDQQFSRVRNAQWKLNYREAAIYLQEGLANDKFTTHPSSQQALPAYFLAHNKIFYFVDLTASLILMGLAFIEPPALFKVPTPIHASLELTCLLVMCVELVLRLRWLGWKTFMKHPRTMTKAAALVIMFIEAIVMLIRETSHMRVTRTIRPLFLLDSYYCSSVRRFIRQLLQSMKPVLEMFSLLFFFMAIFSILGFYLFHSVPDDTYFQTIWTSFISLFILLTTANYPDVMMPAYSYSRWSAWFFIVYLSVELYFVMNLVLAVVYESFSTFEKEKLKKLFVHSRRACQYAFRLLVSKSNPKHVTLRHFQGLMKCFQPKRKKRDVYLTFKTMNTSGGGCLSLDEFYKVYDISSLHWKKKPIAGSQIWSSNFRPPFHTIFQALHWMVNLKLFDIFISIVILANFIWIFVETVQISLDRNIKAETFAITWYSIMFVTIYLLELFLKLLGLGPSEYFVDRWNVFDFIVTLAGACGLFLQMFVQGFALIILLRLFRLLRLFKMSQIFRDVLGTLYILLTRLMSLALAILMIYYIFGIVGLEVFARYDMRDCCKNTSVEQFYVYNNESKGHGYYYLNNFSNIAAAGVTLFELTVVNNWFIIMEGYASVCSDWSRIYFMVFYLIMMVVMNVIVAFLLEAFLFRIQYRHQMRCDDIDDHSTIKIDKQLISSELAVIQSPGSALSSYFLRNPPTTTLVMDGMWYRGERMRSKVDYSLRMYDNEVKEWVEEEEVRLHSLTTVSEMEEFHPRSNPLAADDNFDPKAQGDS